MNAIHVLSQIRTVLDRVYGGRLRGVVIYGSVVRGEVRDDSDIDVLVLLDSVSDYGKDLRTNIDVLYPLAKQMGRRISAKPVTLREYEQQQCPLYRNIHREGIAA